MSCLSSFKSLQFEDRVHRRTGTSEGKDGGPVDRDPSRHLFPREGLSDALDERLKTRGFLCSPSLPTILPTIVGPGNFYFFFN